MLLPQHYSNNSVSVLRVYILHIPAVLHFPTVTCQAISHFCVYCSARAPQSTADIFLWFLSCTQDQSGAVYRGVPKDGCTWPSGRVWHWYLLRAQPKHRGAAEGALIAANCLSKALSHCSSSHIASVCTYFLPWCFLDASSNQDSVFVFTVLSHMVLTYVSPKLPVPSLLWPQRCHSRAACLSAEQWMPHKMQMVQTCLSWLWWPSVAFTQGSSFPHLLHLFTQFFLVKLCF